MKNINFAQTFKPEKQYISCLLKLATGENFLSAKDISLATGIPMGERSGKVIPHIHYSKFMGLIDYEKEGATYKLSLTKLGQQVLNEDYGLREPLSILLLHTMMCRAREGAPIWDEMFGQILPKYHGEISIDDSIRELNKIYDNKITKKNFSPFINSYEDIFSNLKIFEEDTLIQIKQNYVQKIEIDFVYLYGYVLFFYWDENFKDRIEITADEFKSLSFGSKLSVDSQNEYSILELLNEKEIIKLNRQMNPFTISKYCNKDSLIRKLYSELF